MIIIHCCVYYSRGRWSRGVLASKIKKPGVNLLFIILLFATSSQDGSAMPWQASGEGEDGEVVGVGGDGEDWRQLSGG